MTLEQLIDRFDSVERSIVVVNRTDPDPVLNMLVDTFGDDAVAVADADDASAPSDSPAGPAVDVAALRRNDAVPFDGTNSGTLENLALLVEGDEVIAGSTLDELGKAVLFVNSDLYTTGGRTLRELDLPAVITRLEDAVFTLRGYPESNRQKLLLITISRFVERAAWTAGDGTLRSSFQRLSRLNDETGTREVYERVAEAGVDTHLYGVPDDLPRGLDAVVHGGKSADFTDSWFVVYRPPDGPEAVNDEPSTDLERGVRGGVGLLAVEREPRVWQGTWTFDPDRLRELNGYVERNL